MFLTFFYVYFLFFIVKCCSFALKRIKDSIKEYNIILLYSMIWIIWCLLLYLFISSSHLILFNI